MPALPAIVPAPAEPESTPAPPDLTLLRDQLQAVVATGRQASGPWSTGLAQLDRALGGGIPRGRVTEISGPLAQGFHEGARLAIGALEELLQELIGPGRA